MTLKLHPALLAAGVLACGVNAAKADGLYVGGNLGHPEYSNQINGLGGDGANNGGVGAKLFGGYALTPNFAVEGGVFRLGHSRSYDGTVNTRGLYADGVGSYQFAPSWSVLGRVGVAEARFDTTLGNDSSFGVKGGLGVQYDLSKSVALRVEYERYHFTNAFEAKPNVGEYSVGVKFGF